MAETILNNNQIAGSSINWFTGNTGTTLNTGLDLSEANLVKVYKNGLLLQETDSTVSDILISSTDGSNYIQLTNEMPTTLNSFELDYRQEFNILGEAIGLWRLTNLASNFAIFETRYGDGGFWLTVQPAGLTAWTATRWSSIEGHLCDFKVTYDTTNGWALLYKDITSGMTSYQSMYNSPLNDTRFTDGRVIQLVPQTKLYLYETKVYANGNLVFNGETAAENTDFVNHGCTISPIVEGAADYSISSNNLLFTDALTSSDKITVEVF